MILPKSVTGKDPGIVGGREVIEKPQRGTPGGQYKQVSKNKIFK
jgi:hypothetical protein